ncbi:DNA polymerase delta subunit 4 [Zea mays]|uniref:DNA polymerase delta subunit 4 n=1 Tax=Zea mays TaxID=4577 RepID=A0A3L6E2P8_MAIZE|nr:DNA polymerase delta subunit 4 [Zea mays]
MSSGGVKDFYRQKKKGGVAKTASSSKNKTRHYTGGASVGASDAAQTSALVSHGSWDLKDDFGDEEEQLRQFDVDMKFGPCIGVTRLQRWERASAMGLQPPAHLRDLLLHAASTKNRGDGSPSVECLWEGKV